jgi:uncharacterized protein
MSDSYHRGQRQLQEQFDSVRLADRLVEKTLQGELDDSDIAFISRQYMFFLATADADGEPSCTYRGGDPGFVRIIDPVTIAWPEYNGNGMFLALGNILCNPRVHLLFIDFELQKRFRVAGTATLCYEHPLLDEFVEANMVVKVDIEKAFPNCRRYIPKMQLVEESRHIPRRGVRTPVADWKRSDWACDALPMNDPARDPTAPE